MTSRWTFERYAELIRMWQAGMAACEIAHKLGATEKDIHSRVYQLRKRGVELKRRNKMDFKALAKLARESADA